MKKTILTFLTFGIAVNLLYATEKPNKMRVDFNTVAYKPAAVDWAAGGGLAIGFATRDIDFMLASRFLQYDLGTIKPREIIHAFLRADIKFALPNFPVTLLTGMGLGAGSASVMYNTPYSSRPEEKIISGPLGELSFGVMFPVSQTISLLGRTMLLYNILRINDVTGVDISGVGFELGVRFAFENTRGLDY